MWWHGVNANPCFHCHHAYGRPVTISLFYLLVDAFLAVVPFFFIQKLMTLISEVNPTSVFVALDVGKSFRKELFPRYKAHRKPMPRTMQEQVHKY